MNPICYLRFVDLNVQNLRLGVACLNTTTTLLCQGLYVGITNVIVARDLMQLEIKMNSLILQSELQPAKRTSTACQSDGRDGFRVQIPSNALVLSLNLRNQQFLGCKMTGCDEQLTTLVMSTAFIEQTLAARNNVIRMGVSAAGETIRDRLIDGVNEGMPKPMTSSEIEMNGFRLSLELVIEVESGSCVPMQVFADLCNVCYRKRLEPWNDFDRDKEPLTVSGADEFRILVEASIQNVRVHNVAANHTILSLSCIEVQAKQSARSCGVLSGVIQTIDISLDHDTENTLRLLSTAQERLMRCQMVAKAMRKTSTTVDARPVLHESTSQINWNTDIKVTKWLLSFKASAKGGTTHDLTATGSATTIETPLVPLRQNGVLFTKRSMVIQHVSVEVALSGITTHSAVFEGVALTLTASINSVEKSKTLEMFSRFEVISINGLRSENSSTFHRFPALCLHELKVDRMVKETMEGSEVELTIHMEKLVVKWQYQHHQTFLLEWAAFKTIVDQITSLTSKSTTKRQALSKISSTNICAKDTLVDVIEIPDVAPMSSLYLVDTKGSHRATELCATTAFESASTSVRWGEKPSLITLIQTSFEHRSSLGRQRYLTKVPNQSDIRCSSLKMRICPHSQMLLLVLRLDRLISKSSDKGDGAKRLSAHGISFTCEKLSLEMVESIENIGSVELASFNVKVTRCTPCEITETMTRMLQCLGKKEVGEQSFAEVAKQLQVLDGRAFASTISAATPFEKLAELRNTEIIFAITDVEWSQYISWEEGTILPRTTCFDVSTVTEKIDVTLEERSFTSFLHTLPILRQALDTKLAQPRGNTEAVLKPSSFRQRFVGHLELAFQNAELLCRCNNQGNREQRSDCKLTRLLLSELVFHLRQFHTMDFRCSPLRVLLESADSEDLSYRRPDVLQLLFVPKIAVKGVIHWQHPIHCADQLQYALSLEVAIGHTHVYDPPTHVPIVNEALVSLSWDCVVPWLVDILVDNASDNSIKLAAKESSHDKQVQCVGVQVDLSVHCMQFAWWDTVTQEAGMLIVMNEFFTHGVMRMANDLNMEQDIDSSWKLWEATVYSHLFRGYLLRVDDDFASNDNDIPEILPFKSEMASNFSIETVGTSYRSSYTPNADEDWEALDDRVTSMFAPSTVTTFTTMHDGFVAIDYEFSIVNTCKPVELEPPAERLPMLHVPTSIRTSSAASSRPKSPRSAKNWTQTINNRLSQFKRRSASMSNLLLNDGSCPIQVDAMRLLWTLQTRDSVFYMVSTTVDSLRLLLDAKHMAGTEDGQHTITEPASLSPLRRAKGNSFRSPSFVATNFENGPSDFAAMALRQESRRGSARDTLLDLLQQGKLGVAHNTHDLSSTSLNEETESTRESMGDDDTSDANPARASIVIKAYTVDIHDVQINVREECTRSNVLLASKHIHFEIGTDVSDSKTIANLTFDSVTAHVAPIDVDISAGVLWYSLANDGSSSAPGSTLLKQIMDECSLTSSYTHTQSTDATSTEVDLSFLELSTDRHQFYQLINVIRHVLLAPPSIPRRTKRTFPPRTNSKSQQLEGPDVMEWIALSPTTTLAGSTSTKKLHLLLEEELRNHEIRTRGTMSRSKWALTALKAISFKVVGMQWKLRLSPELTGADHEFVGIRIQGFTGYHSYFTDHCTKLTLNLQWLEIINLHPGPSSAAFKDSSAVLKAKLLVDKRFESISAGNQKGMLVVRAESGPIVRVYGQKLRVLKVLEVSMFPEVSNMIVIQLTADFYELLYKFFFENITPSAASSHNSELFFGRKSTCGPVSPIASSSMSSLSQKGASSPFSKPRAPHPTSYSQTTLNPLRKSNSASSTNSMLTETSNLSLSQTSFEDVPDESDSTGTDDCELFYVKYVRVGNVRLRINCNGFFVNLSHFDLDLPPYVCQSKLCTSKKLLQKFESHLKWYITKESASSGLSQFKNKLLKWTPSSAATDGKKDKSSKKQEEDTAAANAQVLFGPYSGA